MEIFLATIENAEEILKLQKSAYQSEAELYQDWTIPPLTQKTEEIREELASKIFYIAVSGNKIIGSVRAYLNETACFIGRLIVHPDSQRQGIGTKLMSTIENHFSGARRYELFTGNKSKGNIRLYRSLGYKPFKEKKVHEALSLIYLDKTNPLTAKRG